MNKNEQALNILKKQLINAIKKIESGKNKKWNDKHELATYSDGYLDALNELAIKLKK